MKRHPITSLTEPRPEGAVPEKANKTNSRSRLLAGFG
jgi:hypothetical protein